MDNLITIQDIAINPAHVHAARIVKDDTQRDEDGKKITSYNLELSGNLPGFAQLFSFTKKADAEAALDLITK